MTNVETALAMLSETGYNFNDEDVEQAPVQHLFEIKDCFGEDNFSDEDLKENLDHIQSDSLQTLIDCEFIKKL